MASTRSWRDVREVSQALERWKRAVVHLEGAADSAEAKARMDEGLRLMRRLAGEGAPAEQIAAAAELMSSRDLRYRGTATLVEAESGRFLVTARHVLRDEGAALRRANDVYRRGKEPAKTPAELTPSERESFDRDVFGIIFRVPGLDEALGSSASARRPFLMNLGAGVSWLSPYTYSAPYLDLAVISLSSRTGMYREFADDLVAAGITPVGLADIADGPSAEGAEVFTVGYPGAVSEQFEAALPTALAMWQSSSVSLPNFSFGRVSLLHEKLPFFWTDLSVYPGNSGGPVVENDRLIGVVSAQAIVPVKFAEALAAAGLAGFAGIPFGRIAKGIHVKELISQQAAKDRAWPATPG